MTQTAGRYQPLAPRTRLSDELADRLLEDILARGLQPGDRLPTERELGEQFDVSRTVVREAVRTLAGQGLIASNRGSGLVVAAVPASTVRTSMRLFLRNGSSRIPYERVHEVRAAIEVEVAGHAAARATNVGIAQLRDIHERMAELVGDGENASEADVEFHRHLTKLTDNELFVVVLDSIGDVLFEVRDATWRSRPLVEHAFQAHQHILDAVAARDPAEARKAMRLHLDEGLKLWQTIDEGEAHAGDPQP